MDFQQFTDCVGMPCCVMSVQKLPNGDYGEIRIICANESYKKIMGPAYYDGMIYSELVPKENKFEDFCYRAAILGQRMHAYVDTRALGCWTDQTLIPMESDREDMGYCQFIFEFTQGPEADRMADVNMETASTVLEACIRFAANSDFKKALPEALDLIIRSADAMGGRIMTFDHENRRAINFCDRVDYSRWPDSDPSKADSAISYELMCSWEGLIGESNAVLIKNEQDMDALAKKNPEWAQSMREYGVTSLVLIPLRRDDEVIGYMYITNFDTSKIVEVKEMTELMGFFLTSEIVNYQLLRKLDRISKKDALTGISNRRAMIERMRALTASGEKIPFGVVNLDLNGLKTVNDLEGHEAGDQLLIQAGEILQKVFYQDDLYRTGGDEFVVITTGIDRETFESKVQRLQHIVQKNTEVSFAIGRFWSDGSDDMTTAFRCADEKMYEDKKAYYEAHPELKRLPVDIM